MLAFMVDLHYRKTRDTVFLKHALPLLKREYAFWMRPGRRAVELRHMGKTYLLNRYFSARASERPESWLADRAASAGMRPEARRRFFAHVAAAAESGWDFSSRWLGADGALRGLLTTEVLPADLNALLLGVERLLAGYCKVFNDGSFRLYLKVLFIFVL